MEISSVSASPVVLADPSLNLRSTAASAPVAASASAANAATPATGASASASVPSGPPDLKAAIEAGSKALQGLNQSLEFQLDPSTQQSVVKVVDTETNQVIQQIPSEQFLQMAKNIEAFQTQLIRDQA